MISTSLRLLDQINQEDIFRVYLFNLKFSAKRCFRIILLLLGLYFLLPALDELYERLV